MKLSIIMPVYNSEKYLKRAVQCVLNQTFRDFELILVDDGSKDRSPIICDELSNSDPRIVVVHQENKGIGGARNTGLEQAKGEYIGFMDNDDLIHPQMFEILIYFAQKENADMVMFPEKWVNKDWSVPSNQYDIDSINYDIVSMEYLYKNMFSKSMSDTTYVTIWNKIIKRKVVKNIRFPLYGTEDTVFNCYLYSKSDRNVFLNIKPDLYYWVQRKSSTSHNGFTNYHCMSLKSYFDMEEYIYNTCPEFHKYVVEKTFRKILSFKYSSKNTEFNIKVKEIIHKSFPKFKKRFYKNQYIKWYKKIMYLTFYYLPVSYNIFRILNDYKTIHSRNLNNN